MERHLLITVSDDMSALYGVRFVNSFFQDKGGVRLTLLFVASGHDSHQRTGAHHEHHLGSRTTEHQHAKGRAALESCRKMLLDNGFRDPLIDCRLVGKRHGTAKDIVNEGHAGLFDAVVLGRRGYALFEKAFATSVSREVMDLRIDFPIWICKRPEEGRKNVLLCVDESEPSMRIADHVGFMLEKEKAHTITVLHVDTGDVKNIDAMMNQAGKNLKDNNIPEDRIKNLIVRSRRVAESVLEETDRGKYAVVAVGRGGSEPKGYLKKWLTGSKSNELLEKIDNAVLWVSK